MNTSSLLTYLAAMECMLACGLTIALFVHWQMGGWYYRKRKSSADGWWTVLIARGVAWLTLPLIYTANQFRFSESSNDEIWAAVLAVSLATFAAFELFVAWKAAKAHKAYGQRAKLCAAIVGHLLMMNLFSISAVYGLFQVRQTGIIDIPPFDIAYVCMAVWAAVLLCTFAMRLMVAHIDLALLDSQPVVGALWSLLLFFCAYTVLLPLHGIYLALMVKYEYELPRTSESFHTRWSSLQHMVPYLDSGTLAILPPDRFELVTFNHERPFDPVYMSLLRRTARGYSRNSLGRLWVLDPKAARDIAELNLNDRKYCFAVNEAVLFLEEPDRPVFKEFIPDDHKRHSLSKLLYRWSVEALPEAVQQWTRLDQRTYHRLGVGYEFVHSKLAFKPADPKDWFVCRKQVVPDELIPSLIDFFVFTYDSRAYELMACPDREYATRAMQALLQGDERRKNKCCYLLRMRDVLMNVHPNVATACMRPAVAYYGEANLLGHWVRTTGLDNLRCIELAEKILTRWNEVVPGAPTLQTTGGGKAAIDAFLLARINQLQNASTTAAK